jgi:hypothetical protein
MQLKERRQEAKPAGAFSNDKGGDEIVKNRLRD